MSSHPDADLHPVATGTARSIVDAHQEEQPLKLYSGWLSVPSIRDHSRPPSLIHSHSCPFVQRAWTVLEEKKIPYQYIEVNPYHKPQSLLSLNPRGLVPTLQYDNQPLYESTVICEFLEEAYPDHGLKLLPEDVYLRAKVRIWIDFCGSRLIPAFHRFLQWQPMSDEEGLEGVRGEFLGSLREVGREMVELGKGKDGPFFLGSQEPGLLDLVVAPWMVSSNIAH